MNIIYKTFLEKILAFLPKLVKYHSRKNLLYILANNFVDILYKHLKNDKIDIFPYNYNGKLHLPIFSLGNLDSHCCIQLPEMILHSYYFKYRNKYKVAVDMGSNIGIDALLMAKYGMETYCYEPDKELYEKIIHHKEINNLKNLYANNYGISNVEETVKFIKVKGNENANHVLGSRESYGETETIQVNVKTFDSILVKPDLMKINIEGHEKFVIPTIPLDVFYNCDTFIEVHDDECRKIIWDYLFNKINIFSQKNSWKLAKNIEDLPTTNKEGYIFVSRKQIMWD